MKSNKQDKEDMIMHKKEFVQENESTDKDDIYDYSSLDTFYDNDEIDFVELNFIRGYNMAI